VKIRLYDTRTKNILWSGNTKTFPVPSVGDLRQVPDESKRVDGTVPSMGLVVKARMFILNNQDITGMKILVQEKLADTFILDEGLYCAECGMPEILSSDWRPDPDSEGGFARTGICVSCLTAWTEVFRLVDYHSVRKIPRTQVDAYVKGSMLPEDQEGSLDEEVENLWGG